MEKNVFFDPISLTLLLYLGILKVEIENITFRES